MANRDGPDVGPPADSFASSFRVYEVRTDGDQLLYYGDPLVPPEQLMEHIWPRFRADGYEVRLTRRTGEYVLVAEPVDVGVDGIPWTNVILAVATVFSTLFAGTVWYGYDPIANPETLLGAWPFTVAIMGVLGVHELGHYVMSRYHGVDATLPYFLPLPTLIGTMGAVIKMKGQMPDRKALFDIGAAGPLAGLVATVVVTAVGLSLPPVDVPPGTLPFELGYPPLLVLIADLTGQQLYYPPGESIHPVVVGGWVGMFVTFLNLLPVGQLDGGHIVRAMAGDRQETVAALVPAVLFGLAGYLHYVRNVAGNAIFLWVFWGLFASAIAFAGPATPVYDESLDTPRMALGALTFLLGALCFTPVPIAYGG
ncbi:MULTISPECIES: site-2 protease family protein [Halostella]|uniref:site-2 protease family protein n=1 Tax=Halostella TaxID=1843185 RepID=UPI00108049BA|nr:MULTISPECIES: site-2 protease family protein [Halostella]